MYVSYFQQQILTLVTITQKFWLQKAQKFANSEQSMKYFWMTFTIRRRYSQLSHIGGCIFDHFLGS